VCGICCATCSVYIASTEEPDKLKWIAQRFNLTEEEVKCEGCRSEKRFHHCKDCTFIACAEKEGVDFCSACSKYPCQELVDFQKQLPHRIELWQHHEEIQAKGWEQWFLESCERYSCPQCATINSAYDLACRRCGQKPASEFIARHGEVIAAHLMKISL